jgi:hypothetical protein
LRNRPADTGAAARDHCNASIEKPGHFAPSRTKTLPKTRCHLPH